MSVKCCQRRGLLCIVLQLLKLPLANTGASRNGDVLLFVCSSVCLSVCRMYVKSVNSFATWQHLAASGGLAYRLQSVVL